MEKKIKDAIDIRDDERNYLDTHGKDLIAIAMHYHKSCYCSYKNARVLDRLQRPKELKASTSSMNSSEMQKCPYDKCVEELSRGIEHEIINNNLVKSMSLLRDQYILNLQNEGIQAPN